MLQLTDEQKDRLTRALAALNAWNAGIELARRDAHGLVSDKQILFLLGRPLAPSDVQQCAIHVSGPSCREVSVIRPSVDEALDALEELVRDPIVRAAEARV